MTDTVIETSGLRGAGINVQGDGTHVGMTGGSITTTGEMGDGATAYVGGTATLNGVVVTSENGRGAWQVTLTHG
ncbi:hypothetical protein NJB93_18895 [Brucella intermedia]|uniref:hypothetical protein n=1 Tax=Brucella intermedia TaxID=94625 RepID=UPI00209AA71C|nr:hypothetical protein [Brucella intermedia]MCO7728656.1 hypothetical protein [Brucella intermedia]